MDGPIFYNDLHLWCSEIFWTFRSPANTRSKCVKFKLSLLTRVCRGSWLLFEYFYCILIIIQSWTSFGSLAVIQVRRLNILQLRCESDGSTRLNAFLFLVNEWGQGQRLPRAQICNILSQNLSRVADRQSCNRYHASQFYWSLPEHFFNGLRFAQLV